MSTLSPDILSPARVRAHSLGARWERLLAVASVCLPIPLLAATGLSIPLPSSVERIGAALVAWVDEGHESAPLPASGDIVLTDAQQAAPEPREQIGAEARAALAQLVAAPAAESTAGSGSKSGGGKAGGGKGGNASGGSGGSGGAGGSGGNDPAPTPTNEPGLIGGTVGTVTKTTEPVVETVEETVDDLSTTVDELLPTEDLLGDDGLLGGLGK
jgi:hypothetical protein